MLDTPTNKTKNSKTQFDHVVHSESLSNMIIQIELLGLNDCYAIHFSNLFSEEPKSSAFYKALNKS